MKYNNQITMTGIAYYPKMATAKNGKGYLSFTLRYPIKNIKQAVFIKVLIFNEFEIDALYRELTTHDHPYVSVFGRLDFGLYQEKLNLTIIANSCIVGTYESSRSEANADKDIVRMLNEEMHADFLAEPFDQDDAITNEEEDDGPGF